MPETWLEMRDNMAVFYVCLIELDKHWNDNSSIRSDLRGIISQKKIVNNHKSNHGSAANQEIAGSGRGDEKNYLHYKQNG